MCAAFCEFVARYERTVVEYMMDPLVLIVGELCKVTKRVVHDIGGDKCAAVAIGAFGKFG